MSSLVSYERFLSYYSKRYEIRFCRLDEAAKLVEFIRVHWKADHALVCSPELLDWQHREKEKQRYNFAVACHKETGEFHAVLGFITTAHFDSQIQHPMLWGAIWKARQDVDEPGLGMLVEMYCLKNVPHELTMGVGLSNDSIANFTSLHYTLGQMDQYFLLNQTMHSYYLCVPNGLGLGLRFQSTSDELVELNEAHYLALQGSCFDKLVSYKSRQYYVGRYFHHPIYRYRLFAICHQKDAVAVLVLRTCEYKDRRCLRIVDYIGDGSELAGNGMLFHDLLVQENAEYIDFLCYGFSKEGLESCGFLNSIGTSAIIPNYYEPFVQSTTRVMFHFPPEAPNKPCFVVKGDADQDRPNIIL